MGIAGKILEALGIAAVTLALVMGFHGDEWGELYFFLGGIGIFIVGWGIEKIGRRAGPEKPA